MRSNLPCYLPFGNVGGNAKLSNGRQSGQCYCLGTPLIISTVEIDEGVATMEIALEAADAHTE
jgi:hypothetical protein